MLNVIMSATSLMPVVAPEPLGKCLAGQADSIPDCVSVYGRARDGVCRTEKCAHLKDIIGKPCRNA